MIAAILDPSGRVEEERAIAALARAGAAATRRRGAVVLGWTGTAAREDADGVVLLEGTADATTHAFTRLREGDASGLAPLRGSFAAIAWSDRRASLALARDHFGRRPLFVATRGDVAFVASEVAPLLAMLPRRPDPDPVAAALWLAFEPLGRRTLYDGVAPVLAGHTLVLGRNGGSSLPYWSPVARSGLDRLDRREAAETLWESLRSAVQRRLSGRERPGVLLSGGLDSSAVLAAAVASEGDERDPVGPPTFSVAFPDHPEVDETRYIDATAARFGSRNTRHDARVHSILSDGEEFLRHWGVPQDFPQRGFFHGALTLAAGAGVDVLLDGEGGDEEFGCDPYLIADLLVRGRLLAAARVAREVPGMGDRVSRRAVEVVVRSWIIGPLLPPAVRARTGRLAGRQFINDTLSPSSRAVVLESLSEGDWRRARGPRAQAHRIDLVVNRPRGNASMDYLRRKAAMAGIATESPLIDPDLLATVLGLPADLAFNRHRDKELLRAALEGRVPEPVRVRTDRTSFERLPIESLDRIDRQALPDLLDGTPELGAFVDVRAASADALSGPQSYRRGPAMWLMHLWRVATLAQWLRSQS